jgi:hypothetical protein
VRDWLAAHLHALVWILLSLWAPPLIFTVLVDLKLAGGAGSGYPSLRDPGLVLAILQLSLMAVALLSLSLRRYNRAWQLLCAALGVWWMEAAWTLQGRLRLIGRSDLRSRETLIMLAALAIASFVIFVVRDRLMSGALTPRLTTGQPPVGRRPGTT